MTFQWNWPFWLEDILGVPWTARVMNDGGLPLRLQRFLLSTLQTGPVQLYQKALDSFKDELDARSVTWSAMDEQDKDVFLAEYFIDLKEADAKRQGCQM